VESADSDHVREPPGPRLLREFVDSLGQLDGVDESVAALLQRLHAEGQLRSAARSRSVESSCEPTGPNRSISRSRYRRCHQGRRRQLYKASRYEI